MDVDTENCSKLLTDGEQIPHGKSDQITNGKTVTPPGSIVKRSHFVDILAVLFGIGSWIGVTSTFLQLPLIVATAPEGWSLPSYMVITVQAANIFSFAYVLYQKYSSHKFNDAHFIYITMIIGCIAAICMSFMYHQTTEIGGSQHSVSLLVFTLMFAIVGCMSSVLCMPYMGRFREFYLVTYLLGQGMNGFLSSILALIQGVGGTPECIWNNSTDSYEKYIPPPRFGPNIFFLFVFAILVCSTVAFALLDRLKVCKNQYAAGTIGLGNEYHYDENDKNKEANNQVPDDVKNLSTFNFIYLALAAATASCFGNSIFPAIQAYSSLPYGSLTYHLAATMAAIANPLACFSAMFIPHTSIRSIRGLSVCALITAVYMFAVALSSPTPPLKDTLIGPILIIASWAAFTAMISFMKLSITAIFRYQEGKSLVLVGSVIQMSSASGALIAFVLVNYVKMFTAYEPC